MIHNGPSLSSSQANASNLIAKSDTVWGRPPQGDINDIRQLVARC